MVQIGFIATIIVATVIVVVLVTVGKVYVIKMVYNAFRRHRPSEQSQPSPNQVCVQPDPTPLSMATVDRFLRDIEREKPNRFSHQELAEFTHNFSQVLGSGGFGVVYKGVFPNGVKVAVKVLKGDARKRVEEQFMAEVGSIGRTYHINLVRLYGYCFDPEMRALVYEYMDKGSLDKFLFGDQKRSIEWSKLHEIAIGTARGIAYLHEECQQRIIHYDIKPGNVLLDSNLNPKVADFGLAKLTNRESTQIVMSGCRGTPGYAAPELWNPYPVTHKCDVYSFGMLLFEILGRRRNHDTNNVSGNSQEWLPRWAYEKFNKGELLDMLSLVEIPEEEKEKAGRIVKVALWCVQYLPRARPMMSVVVKMLEGGVEIETPPNPFDHLIYNLDLGSGISQGSSSSNQYSTSSAWPETNSQSNLVEI